MKDRERRRRSSTDDSASDASSSTREIAKNVCTAILLAGQVGKNPFAEGVGRALVDLPVDAQRSVLGVWLEEFAELAEALGLARLDVRVSVDRDVPAPRVPPDEEHPRVGVQIVRDPQEYRGTAGVVRDLTTACRPDEWVLVANANQVQREPILDVVDALARSGESVSLVPTEGGDLAGTYLLRVARLRDVPEIGFVDLKEQAIPAARGHDPLRVVRRPAGSVLRVRTLSEYVGALRVVHGSDAAGAPLAVEAPFAERWKPVFSIVEPGAQVAPGAVLQDSVVLDGGRVEEGTLVARSVICRGGVVRRGEQIVESVVTGQG